MIKIAHRIKIKMKRVSNIYLILCLLASISLISCAHKSGHKQRNQSNNEYAQNDRKQTVKVRNTHRNHRSEEKMEGAEIFEKYGSAVFMIFTSNGMSGFQGSGFFIDGSGLAVSNYHVFKGTGIGMEQIKLLGSDVAYSVSEVIVKNEDEDFILFRVDCDNTNYLPIASAKPKIGEKVFAIGSPRGLENTFSSGEVSQWRDTNLMQISALIDHGSSGGALINEYGEVVGITSGTFADGSQANLNYAWSIDVIKPYLK
jgi:serine protease Do